ncbi:peptide chain release factor 1 [Anaerorhabdus furcosa]|uniref:Peptide chain release factor 1 n=1 Tax=Anaerorhabdus furcosa TaxID=118967 RepID=A0A1T4KBY5_9FIRM|nr:peptide chain release factor 1 [Anaerorhabdus furcosa]SJZ39896.1 peptide chain release factor 1 [Anaerorhabdus furcosa]
MSAIIERLQKIEDRYNEINDLLISDEIISQPKLMGKLAKEQAGLKQAVDAYEELKSLNSRIDEAHQLLKEDDHEIKEMAHLEIEECEPLREELLEKIEVLLIPKDPVDDNNAIVEIRGAAGGDEGNIFAGDLYRMYARYAETQGWKTDIIEMMEAEAGGFTLVSFIVKGDGAYGQLKFESGSHRVQRVPKTETQGRIHTSTATVLVSPEIAEDEYELNMNDIEIETMRASGAGGQHVNKTDSAVRITHIPTGIFVKCQDGRSQIENRATALNTIRAKVYAEMKRIEDEAKGKERKSKLGTGDRSEKIRTYNYPQNRVTDHRIGLTITQLDRIMEGKMDDVIAGLLQEEQRQKLAGEN